MQFNKKYLPVNWEDGMKVSKTQFIDEQNAVTDSIRNSIAVHLNDYNFGLLSDSVSKKSALSVEVNSERVEVYHCMAITRGGCMIDLTEFVPENLRSSFSNLQGANKIPQASEWFIVLAINPFERQSIGHPDPSESQIRQPNVFPVFSLQLVSAEQINTPEFAAQSIPIAKIEGGYQGIQEIEYYIPPCTTITSSPKLYNAYQNLSHKIKQIDKNMTLVVQKIQHKRRSNQQNVLSDDIFFLSEKMIFFIVDNFPAFDTYYRQLPPIHTVNFFVRLASITKKYFAILKNKEGMLAYFSQYLHLKYGEFEKSIDELINHKYNHFDIRKSLEKVNAFVNILDQLFSKLKELDYGQIARYDPIVQTGFSGTPPNQGTTHQKTSSIDITPRNKKKRDEPKDDNWFED